MAIYISPQEALRLTQEEGAKLIDVRDPDEYGATRIPGAYLQPLSVLELLPPDDDLDKAAIFFCQKGNRTGAAAGRLDSRGHKSAYVITGGLEAWKKAGLPVAETKGPIPIMRQVRVAAGSLVLLFLLLGEVDPALRILAALVAAGLVWSGLSGSCGLAAVLAQMPWNKKS